MTWVIGSPTPFGYAIGLSDVQVSWRRTKETRDCLRKVYEVAPFIAAGFSGSVRIGFELLTDLARFLSPQPDPGESWIPRWVALNWWRRARRIFDAARRHDSELQSSIMLMGVRPTDNAGVVTGGRPDVIVLSWKREFQPQFVDLGDVVSIGSGNDVPLYVDEIRSRQAHSEPFSEAEIGVSGGSGRAWMSSLTRMLIQNPKPGISRHVHCIHVLRDRVRIEPLNLERHDPDGMITEYTMPKVAVGWKQFQEFSRANGLAEADAAA